MLGQGTGTAADRARWAQDAQRTRRALTVLLAGAFVGLVGVYWDIAWHIDKGRDSFFTLPHNLIYAGMLAVLVLTTWTLLRDRRQSPAHLPVGRFSLQLGLLVGAVGALLVLGFGPLDELWHHAFGEDLTLWGPMHLVGLAGFAFATLGGLVASVLEDRIGPEGWPAARWHAIGYATALVGLFVLHLAEWEYGVPAFPLALHPLLLAGLPVLAFVLVARLDVHPWAATLTGLAFTAVRGLLHLMLVGTSQLDLAGVTRPQIPLLILTGLAVDLAARRVRSHALVGAIAAAVTLAANAPVNRIDQAYPWTLDIAPEAILGGLALGALAGWVGGTIARVLSPPDGADPEGAGPGSADPGTDAPRAASTLLALGLLAATLAAPAALAHPTDPSTVEPVGEATVRTVHPDAGAPATFEIELSHAGSNVTESTLLATLRGGEGELLARETVQPDADGVYRFSAEVPPGRAWSLRVHEGYGFDLVDAIAEGQAPADGSPLTRTQTVDVYSRYPDVPEALNLWGYTAYGIILAGAGLGVGWILRRVGQAELPGPATASSQPR